MSMDQISWRRSFPRSFHECHHQQHVQKPELLLQAASCGDLRTLIRLKSELDFEHLNGSVPIRRYEALQYAASSGNARMVKELLPYDVHSFGWCFTKEDHAQFDSALGSSRAVNKWFFYGDQVTSSPLHIAVKEGHVEVVEELIHFFHDRHILSAAALGDYDKRNDKVSVKWFRELIEWAVRWGHAPIVKLLLNEPLLPIYSLPVLLATYHSQLDVLNELFQYCNEQLSGLIELEAYSKDGLTALHLAAQTGSVQAVELLINIGDIDVNARSVPEMFTPLHMAANFGRKEVTQFLLQSLKPGFASHAGWKVDLMARDCMGRTALHYAAREGHEDVLKQLLRCAEVYGNDIASITDYDGLLALHMAARSGNANVIRVLRAHGGINKKAKHSLHLRKCLEREYMTKAERIDSVYYGRSVIFPRPRLIDSLFLRTEGFTALHFAARYGHEAAVKELLKEGSVSVETGERIADLNLTDSEGFLAYDWMKVQMQGKNFLQCIVEQAYPGCGLADDLKKASCIRQKLTSKKRLQAIAAEIKKERQAMEELQHAWQIGSPPPITMFILQLLEDEELGGGRMCWLHFAVHEGDMVLLKRLLRVPEKTFVNEKDCFGCTAFDLALKKGDALAVNELLSHLSIEVDAVEAFACAVNSGKFTVAKEILLLRPEIILGNRVTKEVQQLLKDWSPSHNNSLAEEKLEDFLVFVVAQKELLAASNVLRWMLPWAKERGAKRLVEVILDRPELKRGLYEDRQVYLDCANAILVGAALIAGVAFQGWLQPPLGYGLEYGGEEYAEVHRAAVRMFWWINNGAFFLAVGALVAGAKGAVPVTKDIDIAGSVEMVKRAVAVASVFLGLALVCVVLAFITAGFAVLPPLSPDLQIMRVSMGWGGTVFAFVLLWFSLSVWPLFLHTLFHFWQTLRARVRLLGQTIYHFWQTSCTIGHLLGSTIGHLIGHTMFTFARETLGALFYYPCHLVLGFHLFKINNTHEALAACEHNRRYKRIFLVDLVPKSSREYWSECGDLFLDWG